MRANVRGGKDFREEKEKKHISSLVYMGGGGRKSK